LDFGISTPFKPNRAI